MIFGPDHLLVVQDDVQVDPGIDPDCPSWPRGKELFHFAKLRISK
jgi:hypothetical protein